MRWAVFIVCTWPNCLFPPLRIANMDNVRIRFLLVIRLMAFVHQEQHACTCSRYSLSWNYNIEPQRERTYLLTCAPNEDSISLRICAVWSESSLHVYRINGYIAELPLCTTGYQNCAQWRFWSDREYACWSESSLEAHVRSRQCHDQTAIMCIDNIPFVRQTC